MSVDISNEKVLPLMFAHAKCFSLVVRGLASPQIDLTLVRRFLNRWLEVCQSSGVDHGCICGCGASNAS